jgi:hypothetical protein
MLAVLLVLMSVIGVLVAVVAFMAGAMRTSASVAPAAITVIAVPPTTLAATPQPPVAVAAYPAPDAPTATAVLPTGVPAANPPVFDPARPTAAQDRTLAAAEAPTLPAIASVPTPADFQLAPPDAQPAPTLASVAPIPTVIIVPTAPSTPPTAIPPRSAASNPASGGDDTSTNPPTRPVAHVIRGNTTWTAAQGPIVLKGDLEIVRGASLLIGEGVEIQIPRAASLIINGNLYALGSNARPIRISQIGDDRNQRWGSMFARPGSSIVFNNVEISGGGTSGILLGAELSDVKIRSTRIIANGGQLRFVDSRIEIRDVAMRNNDMPYGAAIEAIFSHGGVFTLTGSRLQSNTLTPGTASVLVTNQSFSQPVTLEIVGNLLVGQEGPNLQLFTNAQMTGNVTCNTMTSGSNGLSLRSDAPPNLSPMINIRDNAIEAHTPPIIDIYLEFGIGRGATSDLPLGMSNNWWELANGPFDPLRNNDGRGEAVGKNVTFSPWLGQRPSCAPKL